MPQPPRYKLLWWHEEDVTFFFELDEEGYALRSVLRDRHGEFTDAVRLDEWRRARAQGDLDEYIARWGHLPLGRQEGPVPAPSFERTMDRDEFETVWRQGRSARLALWESEGRAAYEARDNRPRE